MSQEDTNAEAGGQGLDVQLAQELVQRARQEGVSLIGPDGLLAGVTRTALQTALDAEMTEHLVYASGDQRRPVDEPNSSADPLPPCGITGAPSTSAGQTALARDPDDRITPAGSELASRHAKDRPNRDGPPLMVH